MTIDQLAESHLVTVQREIENLKQRVKEAEGEVEKLQEYFNQGVKVLNEFRSPPQKATSDVSKVSSVLGE